MCFSATASFVAGASLSLIGLISISYSRSLKQRMIAAIPLSFGIQQFAEGLVWKGMEAQNDLMVGYAAHIFLFIAAFFWPVWIPLTMRTIETHEKRRAILTALTAGGGALGCFLIYQGLTSGILVRIVNCHIMYTIGNSISYLPESLAYILVTIVPFFIVLNPLVNLMGIAIAVSYVISYLFYIKAFISVWCFFAAIISFFAAFIIYKLDEPIKRKR
jgi:hypothetical protein